MNQGNFDLDLKFLNISNKPHIDLYKMTNGELISNLRLINNSNEEYHKRDSYLYNPMIRHKPFVINLIN